MRKTSNKSLVMSAPMVIRFLGFDGSNLENGENFVQYKNRRYVFDQPLINSGIVRHPRAITIKREPFDRKNLLRWVSPGIYLERT